MRRFFAGLLILATALLAGCASSGVSQPAVHKFYDGDKKPATEIAVLRSKDLSGPNGQDWFGESTKVRLTAINDKPGPNRLGYGNGWNGAFRIELLPGTYTLQIGYADMQSSGTTVTTSASAAPKTVSFTAEAGHEYILDAEGFGSAWLATLRDATTQKVVFPVAQQ